MVCYWPKNRSAEQDTETRNEPRRIWSINLKQRSQEHTMGRGQSLQSMELGKLDMQKDEIRPLSCTLHKNQLKMD